MDTRTLDLVGAVTAIVIYVSSILTFGARMAFGVGVGHWIGYPILATAVPLGLLLVTAIQTVPRRLHSTQTL